jgi:ferredoxin
MAKPVIDKELCIGCGNCRAICPEVFDANDDGRSIVTNPEACDTCDCQEAINLCPAEAISWEE